VGLQAGRPAAAAGVCVERAGMMDECLFAGGREWYLRLVELFEFTATRKAVTERLPALLAAAGDGIGTPPVRVEGGAMIVPAELYDLLLKLVNEHGLGGQVQVAVDTDYERQEALIRSAAQELGLDPDAVAPRSASAATRRSR
jgi:hypothetical protein